MTETFDVHLPNADAFAWHMEHDPLLRSTICSITMYDRAPDWDVLVDRVDRSTRLAPAFRHRLVESPLPFGRPRWEIDTDFDLSWHLRRVAAPEPRNLATVLEFARNTAMQAFDPARALWEFTLIEGLQEGRAALVMKVHHSLTDGIGGIQLAAHVVDLTPEPTRQGPMPPEPEGEPYTTMDWVRDGVEQAARAMVSDTRQLARNLPATVWGLARDPVGTVSGAARTAGSVFRFAQPVSDTLSPVMSGRRLAWHYDVLDVQFADLRAASKAAGGTVNDGFLGGIAGGLRLYHEKLGAPVDELRVTMPISLRAPGDPAGGNKVTLARFKVPIAIEDPTERMQVIDARCAAWRHEPAIPYSSTIAGVLNLLPSAYTGGMLKHVDFLASNVPGFPEPVWVGGAEVLNFYPFGPTIGAGANITLMSFRDTCFIGVNTDAAAVPDPELFLACLRDGFEEVLALAGDHTPVRLPVQEGLL
ncbi:MAG: WS/DGAT domain-containing protein [Acidimicrobiales bacterium]|jgi:WS/DGAT/MGAT family acyltransferase|nr:WS/DGAT domain-containing protein [Acidimicrobiales bacterium]